MGGAGAQGGDVPQQQPLSPQDPEGVCKQQIEELSIRPLDWVASRRKGGRNG